jgi:hypothetical protein
MKLSEGRTSISIIRLVCTFYVNNVQKSEIYYFTRVESYTLILIQEQKLGAF